MFVLGILQNGVFYEALKEHKVTFLKFRFSGVRIPDDAIIVAPAEFSVLTDCLSGINLRFLFWSLDQMAFEVLDWWRILAFLEYQLQYTFPVKVKKILMKLLRFDLYVHVKNFYRIASKKQGIIYMSEADKLCVEKHLDIVLDGSVIPICVDCKSFKKEYSRRTDRLRVCWLGRFCGIKYSTIRSVIEDLRDFARKHPETFIHLDLVGWGSFEGKVKKCCLKSACSNFIASIRGELKGEALENYLKNNIDVMFAHGTSVLEGGKLCIPSVIACGEICETKLSYTWLFEAPENYLGSMTKTERPEGRTMEEMLIMFQRSGEEIGKMCYEYVKKYYDIAVIARDFLASVQATQLNLEDIKKTGVSRHTFFSRMIDGGRCLKATLVEKFRKN